MIGTINCVYETPCGWCSKWDKECNRKIRNGKYKKDSNPAIIVADEVPPMPLGVENNVLGGKK